MILKALPRPRPGVAEAPGQSRPSTQEPAPVGSLPSPWETRALAALLEYRRKEFSIWEIVAKHGLLSVGAHVPAEGSVPGAPELHYNTDERRCELRDQETGIYHYVHAWQSEPCLAWDDSTNFATAYKQRPGCSAPILSFAEVEPSLDFYLCDDYPWSTPTEVWGREEPDEGMILIMARDLEDAGVVVKTWFMPHFIPGLLIADEVLAIAEALRSAYSGTADPRDRLWRMACVGDWLGADDAALELGKPALAEIAQERDAQCREGRLGRIRAQITRDGGLAPADPGGPGRPGPGALGRPHREGPFTRPQGGTLGAGDRGAPG